MKNSNNAFLRFLRKNAAYFVLGLCILAIGLSVTLVLVNRNKSGLRDNEWKIIQTTPLFVISNVIRRGGLALHVLSLHQLSIEMCGVLVIFSVLS